jgi:hypothetical protein
MLNKRTSSAMIDLLFNLLLTFVVLFFLSFLMVNDPQEDEVSDIISSSTYIITMNWDQDCDIDIWVEPPSGNKVYYGRRESGPVHLDLDVVRHRAFTASDGEIIMLTDNQEIVNIRGILEGEYVINAHYFGNGGEIDVPVQFIIQDVKGRSVVWAGSVIMHNVGHEVHVVRMVVLKSSQPGYPITQIIEGKPKMIVGRP